MHTGRIKAGPELDALIMGRVTGDNKAGRKPSTNIADAFWLYRGFFGDLQLILTGPKPAEEREEERQQRAEMDEEEEETLGGWKAELIPLHHDNVYQIRTGEGDTAELALTRAMLVDLDRREAE